MGRTVIPIKIRDVESNSSSYQKYKSNNSSLSFQPTSAKPPSGCRTLPVPRKSYGSFNARKSETGHGQLPFGGGFDLQIFESELQVNAGVLITYLSCYKYSRLFMVMLGIIQSKLMINKKKILR